MPPRAASGLFRLSLVWKVAFGDIGLFGGGAGTAKDGIPMRVATEPGDHLAHAARLLPGVVVKDAKIR